MLCTEIKKTTVQLKQNRGLDVVKDDTRCLYTNLREINIDLVFLILLNVPILMTNNKTKVIKSHEKYKLSMI